MDKRQFLYLLTLSAILPANVGKAASNNMLPVNNKEYSLIQNATVIGHLNSQKIISFRAWVKLRNEKDLKRLAEEIYDPKSSKYQHFLTQTEFDKQFSPSPKVLHQLQKYFQRQGLQAEIEEGDIQVTGTVNQVEKALKIGINEYKYQQKTVYANTSAPLLPAFIAKHITGISGLSNISHVEPKYRKIDKTRLIGEPHTLNFEWTPPYLPSAIPTNISTIAGFSGAHLRLAYDLDYVAPVNGVTIDGSGQTIVIIDGCGLLTRDEIREIANRYNRVNNLPLFVDKINFRVVQSDGQDYQNNCPTLNGWDDEIMLDIQSTHTVAPGANIVLVMTNNVDNRDVKKAMDYIMNHNFSVGGFSNAYVVSNSWGDTSLETQSEFLESTYLKASTRGLSVNFAAGDCGDQTYNSSWTCTEVSNQPTVEYPVSSPYVTAVSGTSLFVDNSWNYAFEAGWGTRIGSAFYSGSMGGISRRLNTLPVWQASISDFEVGGYSGTVTSNPYNNTGRALPDIAMLADAYTGLNIYVNKKGATLTYGGASLSTPLFSGVLALVNQARSVKAGGRQNPIGQAAPYLYLNNEQLLATQAIRLVVPPHLIISGAQKVEGSGPKSAFKLLVNFEGEEEVITFGWDSSLRITENQFWNDVVGVGSPNIPNFVQVMTTI
ncbi:serine protease, subtilase family (plasmid) [Legionella adelaidensis]|uniref:Serine protease, subtilase family n=1 Tax=Legionella adelaidensis TaxID=45056 RepID=A0A0W0R145_9GAMM|nr:S53 family peptidase [Legionella adelaidensis]KTC64815.1 serine protease, subtilase family [Legionella adelaidensis]VEH86195.1 serine protease, subtilase family [Legionella adelaidensis]